jgi:two-component system torCAD operon response regulator TorR
MDSEHVLIVEDEPVTRAQLSAHFSEEGFRVTAVEDGTGLPALVTDGDVILVLLDIRLPGADGLALTRQLRAHSDVGIILVTSRLDRIDRIVGLESGADDYVTKPFDARELVTRAKNLIRRVRAQQRRGSGSVRRFEGFQLDQNRRELTAPDGQRRPLSGGEFQLLLAFLEAPGQVQSRDQLMNRIRNREWLPDDRYIDVLVGQLRKKLGERAGNARIITTVHGAGYLFAAEVA